MRSENWRARFRVGPFCLCVALGWFVCGVPKPVFSQIPQRSDTATEALTETIRVDLSAPTHPFPHFWEQMFGSGRAILSLRESYRRDLRDVKQATDFKYIRFHAILHDEVGVYDEDARGSPIYNFSYADQIYDGLLENGVRPFVELSFMPGKLAASQIVHSFWYRPVVSLPKSWEKWGDLITHLAQHLVDRYGIDEVSQWYFEVWNEPNLNFWAGDPREETYFQLYDVTARALKSVSPRIRVGGPATAQAAWVDRFIRHVFENRVPADFVSTHVYGNDSSADVFGTNEAIPRSRMVCRAAKKVYDQVKSSDECRTANYLQRIQRELQERNRGHRFRVHGSVAGGHNPPMRRADGHPFVLDVFGRIRRARGCQSAVLWRVWPDCGRGHTETFL